MQPLNEILRGIKFPHFKRDINQESVFTKPFRKEAARWLCTLSHDYCLSIANNELKSYFKSRNKPLPYK